MAVSSLRIFIAEDFRDLALFYEQFLGAEPDLQVVGKAHGPENLVHHIRAAEADVVLLDLHLQGADCRPLIPELSRLARVIVISGSSEAADIDATLRAGASGYVVKSSNNIDEVLEAVRAAQRGQVWRPSQGR